jgi:hypothetical protein
MPAFGRTRQASLGRQPVALSGRKAGKTRSGRKSATIEADDCRQLPEPPPPLHSPLRLAALRFGGSPMAPPASLAHPSGLALLHLDPTRVTRQGPQRRTASTVHRPPPPTPLQRGPAPQLQLAGPSRNRHCHCRQAMQGSWGSWRRARRPAVKQKQELSCRIERHCWICYGPGRALHHPLLPTTLPPAMVRLLREPAPACLGTPALKAIHNMAA